jgi:uncharacterized membrane protein
LAAAASAAVVGGSAAAALREAGRVRILSNLLLPRSALARRFPAHALTAIEDAVEASEKRHRAEIRVAVEVALDVRELWRVRSARNRALEVFTELGVWNTRERNGVLIYVLLAERDVEIVADSGFDGRVQESEWQRVCGVIGQEFEASRWRDGVLRGIEEIGVLLTREFPPTGSNPNEQHNRPAIF